MEDGVEGIGGISSEEVSSSWGSVSVEDSLSSSVEETGELWNDLLGELVRSVDIVRSNDDDRKLVRLVVSIDNHLCGSLGGSVWVGWCQKCGLEQIVTVSLDLTVDLISGDVDESFDTCVLGTLEQDVCSQNVVVGEGVRVSE